MITKEQAIDILEKFDLFQGQRAGRELWQHKSFDVQMQDISNFSRDVALLKEYINYEVTSRDEVTKIFGEIEKLMQGWVAYYRQDDYIQEACAIELTLTDIAKLKKKYTEEQK